MNIPQIDGISEETIEKVLAGIKITVDMEEVTLKQFLENINSGKYTLKVRE